MNGDKPTAASLAWIRRQLAWADDIRPRGRLAGATSSSLYEIEAFGTQRAECFVLRLIDNAKWLEECPEIARQEAEALEQVASLAIPAPKLIAVDQTGEACGHPAVLMTHLKGRVELQPPALDRYLDRLAESLVAIHGIDPSGFDWKYDPWFDIETARPPHWTARPKEWETAIAVVAKIDLAGERAFLHRDYHPTNLLWMSGEVSAIVDWPNACVGPRSVDLAHCRANLAALFGVGAADRFLETYLRLAEPPLDYDLVWDLVTLLGIGSEPLLYRPWFDFGLVLTEQDVIDRREDLLLSALATRLT